MVAPLRNANDGKAGGGAPPPPKKKEEAPPPPPPPPHKDEFAGPPPVVPTTGYGTHGVGALYTPGSNGDVVVQLNYATHIAMPNVSDSVTLKLGITAEAQIGKVAGGTSVGAGSSVMLDIHPKDKKIGIHGFVGLGRQVAWMQNPTFVNPELFEKVKEQGSWVAKFEVKAGVQFVVLTTAEGKILAQFQVALQLPVNMTTGGVAANGLALVPSAGLSFDFTPPWEKGTRTSKASGAGDNKPADGPKPEDVKKSDEVDKKPGTPPVDNAVSDVEKQWKTDKEKFKTDLDALEKDVKEFEGGVQSVEQALKVFMLTKDPVPGMMNPSPEELTKVMKTLNDAIRNKQSPLYQALLSNRIIGNSKYFERISEQLQDDTSILSAMSLKLTKQKREDFNAELNTLKGYFAVLQKDLKEKRLPVDFGQALNAKVDTLTSKLATLKTAGKKENDSDLISYSTTLLTLKNFWNQQPEIKNLVILADLGPVLKPLYRITQNNKKISAKDIEAFKAAAIKFLTQWQRVDKMSNLKQILSFYSSFLPNFKFIIGLALEYSKYSDKAYEKETKDTLNSLETQFEAVNNILKELK